MSNTPSTEEQFEKDGKIYTTKHGGITRVISRTDVLNIISSINMTLKKYGILFDLDAKENLQCINDGVQDLITFAKEESFALGIEQGRKAERERIIKTIRRHAGHYVGNPLTPILEEDKQKALALTKLLENIEALTNQSEEQHE